MSCHNHQDRIPFVFLIGLATSIGALHLVLPKSELIDQFMHYNFSAEGFVAQADNKKVAQSNGRVHLAFIKFSDNETH
ncbi:hypothetical protein BGZ65_007788 [Modicella reniformis]|uniref:Uncharacterized protein n=1 Tax=Modicella reniformis TaxID=1440133 RepID=A0A9P6MFM4_9FUNG|nr:hypothetical protein BGZ65_007788 [Modicella reniformis]